MSVIQVQNMKRDSRLRFLSAWESVCVRERDFAHVSRIANEIVYMQRVCV
jgi:hypothetical protein